MKTLRPALVLLGLFTLLTGLVYPAVVTGAAQLVFPRQANGSLIEEDGHAVGSALIGQGFTSPAYVWGRPSATGPFPYNAFDGEALTGSSGSNLGPTNPALLDAVRARVAALRAADPGNTAPVPVDLVTASGSGLDPHVSPAAARYQAARVARARGITEAQVNDLIRRHTEGRTLGVLGEPRVNVLALNLDLDRLAPHPLTPTPAAR
ncbi:MAG TPA: potassium-transporting ATPase subunit KdpC [Rhodothermales bacterium]|nr:potassium-transporting ATPase subunit KdpC [Rhodothermales bacterium]